MQRPYLRIAVIAVAAAAIIVGTRLSPEKHPSPEADAKAYADAAVVAVCTDWNRQKLMDRAAPELAAALQTSAPKEYFVELPSLGPLKTYEGSTGETKTIVYNGNSKTTVNYTARAQFERGPATVKIALVRLNESDWQIAQFQVEPDAGKTP